MGNILEVDGLQVSFQGGDDHKTPRLTVLDNISFNLAKGRVLGLVGESGCGKSVTSMAIMRLLPQPSGQIDQGRIIYQPDTTATDLLQLPYDAMRQIRGRKIAMIFQEPMTALNPVQTVGRQLQEVFSLHFPQRQATEVHQASIQLLEQVGIPAPEQRLKEYPHQLSGGMRQRVVIAIALAGEPEILIADEPTTALDVTIQHQILMLIKQLQHERNMSVIFITHDLGVVAQMCDDVAVMYAGRIVEQAPVAALFARPRHPYTQGLLASIPRLDDQPKQTLQIIPGQVPALTDLPSGCRFRNRCIHAQADCATQAPALETTETAHQVACLYWDTLSPVPSAVNEVIQ